MHDSFKLSNETIIVLLFMCLDNLEMNVFVSIPGNLRRHVNNLSTSSSSDGFSLVTIDDSGVFEVLFVLLRT